LEACGGVAGRVCRTGWEGAKKMLVTFHEQKPIDYLITKTYTMPNIKQIIKMYNM
jgi:hypothetical protein